MNPHGITVQKNNIEIVEKGATSLLHTWHAHALTPGKHFRTVKSVKNNLGLSPSKDGFCKSETKHDRRTVPRPKSFVSMRRSQEQGHKSEKTILGSVESL
jgi:hypothetical protein